jgi:hypothetical protein
VVSLYGSLLRGHEAEPPVSGRWKDLNDFILLIVLAGLGCIAAYVAYKWPSTFNCPHCGRFISSQITWFCGFCKVQNPEPKGVSSFSFLDRCPKCQSVPKAFICFHCGKSIFLDNDNDDKYPAYHLLPKIPAPPVTPPVVPPAPVPPTPEEKSSAELKAKQAEKQRIDADTEILNSKIQHAAAQARYVKETTGAKEPYRAAIDKMLSQIDGRRKKLEALMQYENQVRAETNNRNDITEEQKVILLDYLASTVEETRVAVADTVQM